MSKNIIVKLKKGSLTGPVVATTTTVTITGLNFFSILANDFVDGTLTGTITTDANRDATLTKFIQSTPIRKLDFTILSADAPETLYYSVENADQTPIPEFYVVASSPTVDETDKLGFIILTKNVPDGTGLSWRLVDNAGIDTYIPAAGTVVINSNIGYVSGNVIADQMLEGLESVYFELVVDNIVQNRTPLIYIRDTSDQGPPPLTTTTTTILGTTTTTTMPPGVYTILVRPL